MLSFGLKVAWFILSLSGTICCWVIMTAFALSVNVPFGLPLIYCMAVTLLEGVFCIGMIWRMDPFLMPPAFCTAQTLLISYASYVLTGVAGAFTYATTMCVLRPKDFATSSRSLLIWRPLYYGLIVVFPFAALGVDIAVVLMLDAAKPTDDLHCDASDPIWVRFVGYAGTPFLIAIPCFYFSTLSSIRVIKAHRQGKKNQEGSPVHPAFTIPPRPAMTQVHSPYSPSDQLRAYHAGPSPKPSVNWSLPVSPASRSHPISAGMSRATAMPGKAPASPILSNHNFHLPLSPSLHDLTLFDEPREAGDADSSISTSLPTFAPMGKPAESSRSLTESQMYISSFAPREKGREDRYSGGDVMGQKSSPSSDRERRLIADFATRRRMSSRASLQSTQPAPPNLVPAIWRLLVFQLAFSCTLCLTAISTIIDIASRRSTPSPLGTQHVALLLAGWGPLVVFGHFRGVRERLKFWKWPLWSKTDSTVIRPVNFGP